MDEIRQTLQIEDDFTQEEKEEMQREQDLAEEFATRID